LNYKDQNISDTLINEVMSFPVHSISKQAELADLDRLFLEQDIRHCLVTNEDGSLYGIVSKSDLVHAMGLELYLSVYAVEKIHLIKLPELTFGLPLADAKEAIQNSGREAATVMDESGMARFILTQRDLMHCLAAESAERTVNDIPLSEVVRIRSTTSALEALRVLKEEKQGYLQVIDADEQAIGFVGLKAIHRVIELEYISHLKDSLHGSRKELAASNKHLELANRVIEASLNSIMITDANGYIVSVNPSFVRATGYSEEEVVGKKPSLLKSGLHNAEFYKNLNYQLKRHGEFEGEIWNRRKNGEVYAEWLSINAIVDEQGEVYQYASIFNDITKQKIMEEENLRLSLTDSLTGLPNRRTFTDRLEMALGHAVRHNHKLAVLAVSIDHHKQISNTLGHAIGDEVIVQFASRLMGIVRKEDVVARLGEDEFAILLPQVDNFDGTQRVINAITDFSMYSFIVENKELFMTSSTGISFCPDETRPLELLNNAETAMQQARDSGPNSYRFYTKSMNADSRKRLDMQSLLRGGLSREEFSLHYQPKVCLQSRQVISQEALMRWHNPDMGGAIPPSTFIPMAEKLGLIEDLSRWVIREACAQNKSWMNEGIDENRMSVNVSTIHLRRGNLLRDIEQILDELEYDPEHLDLEITESAFMDNIKETSRTLTRIRDMGISIAIDDFGTGYSSLSYLKSIPADILKIDASFVKDLHKSKNDQKITQAIISMAHHLDFKVVAEGVENEKQLNILEDFGCDQVQGYFFSQPLTAQDYLHHTQVFRQAS
jgi:diguanylate cyclase (GGDEF)-like protein/PAS domain S-box-containing protein